MPAPHLENSRKKKGFMGRNGHQWIALMVYYICFYTALFGSCYVMLMFVYLQPQEKPTMTMDTVQPIIYSPGLGMRPILVDQSHAHERSPLIVFNPTANDTYKSYTKSIADYLEFYKGGNTYAIKDCHKDTTTSCPISLSLLGPCSGISDKAYGYSSGNPCVLLKVNKIYGWKPEAYDKSPFKLLGSNWSNDKIGLYCQEYQMKGDGENAKNTSWSVQLHPPDGFPFSCFPFCDKDKYASPLVMAQFFNLPANEEVDVWCRLFAKNVQLHKRDRAGSVRFSLKLGS